MGVTTPQLMLAAVCGTAGILAAFMPAIAVSVSFLAKDKNQHDDTSIWKFMFLLMIYQFLVAVFFYWGIHILNSLNKFAGMEILGKGGAFELFWTVNAVYATAEGQTWSTIILTIRSIVKTLNAFLPVAIVLGGVYIGYMAANRDIASRGPQMSGDFIGVGLKVFAAAFIASVVYYGWAQIASTSMMMPSTIDGQYTMLADAAQQWWREALGVKIAGKPAEL